MNKRVRPIARVFAASLAATCVTFAMPAVVGGAAAAEALQTYALENVKTQSADGTAEVFIPRIEVVGANVTRADIERLLSPDLPQKTRAELTMNLQAQRIFVPQVVIARAGEDKQRFVLRDYLVTNLDRARFDRLSLGGVEGTITTEDKGEGKFTSGPITLEDGDFSKVAAAAKAGAPGDGVAKLRGFSWAGFEMSVPDKDTSASAAGGNLYRIGIRSIRATTDYAGDVPTKAVAHIEGVFFHAPPATEAGRALSSFGYDRVELGINFDGAYNPATKNFALTEYSISGVNAGLLALSGAFAQIESSAFTADTEGRLAALMQGKVNGVSLRYVDSGLFQKALAFYAASQGRDVSAVRKEWSMMIVGMLPILMGGDPAALKLSEALSTFVNQPKSLAISLKGKNGPLGLADLVQLADPARLLSLVEITAVANR